MATDPNAAPPIPGWKSASLNTRGDISPKDVVLVRTVYGDTCYVDKEQLGGSRQMLRQHRKNGSLLGKTHGRDWFRAPPLYRGNIVRQEDT